MFLIAFKAVIAELSLSPSTGARPDAEHVSEALRGAAARRYVCLCAELKGLVLSPGHMDMPVFCSTTHFITPTHPVRVIIIIGADAGQAQHGVPVLHQLSLQEGNLCMDKHTKSTG